MFSIIKEQKCMPHILSAYGIHIWIMVYTWIEYHDRCLNWEKKKDTSLDNAGARMQNRHKHFLFSPRFNSTVCNKGLQKSNHSTWKKRGNMSPTQTEKQSSCDMSANLKQSI